MVVQLRRCIGNREGREGKRKSTGGNLTRIAHALLTRTGYFSSAFRQFKK
jgi:hypothetical protein